ncbi:MAG TPA: hypothetical protein PLE35_12780 [Lentisphaeria bacterium]|nr:hypothetical protein [Lentisphaeria bacterium]
MFLHEKVVLAGVGQVKLQLGGVDNTTNPAALIGHASNFGIEFSADQAEARGGDKHMPLATRVTNKNWRLSMEKAYLQAEAIQLTQGTLTVPSGTTVSLVKVATITISATTMTLCPYITGQCAVEYANGDGRLEQIAASATPSAGQFAEIVPSSGTYKFSAADVTAGAIVKVWYNMPYNVTTNVDGHDIVVLGGNTQPCNYALWYIHEQTQCGETDYMQVHFLQVRPTGELSIPSTTDAIVSMSNINFIVEDPGRPDGVVGIICLKKS